ncbi:MAG: sirohydrochlorin chelatase [Acidimicrobiales bacterium]
MAPALIGVAHGSREEEAQAEVERLMSRVASRRPDLQVHLAYVELARPRLAEVLRATGPQTVVVPLLLSRGHHLVRDLEAVADTRGVPVAPPLGPDGAFCSVLADRLAGIGVPLQAPVWPGG